MGIREIVNRSVQSDQAGRRERLASPNVIQAGRAVRHATMEQRFAETTESAPANDHITCNLLNSYGDAVKEIEVYCTIVNGTLLNDCDPRLPTGVVIPVAYFMNKWHCLWPFMGSEDCVCTEPP